VRLLGGKPLIAYSVEAGLAAPSLSSVVCSTDDPEIAAAAAAAGARIPFMRPAIFARDESPTSDVGIHALDELAKHGEIYDWLLLLQPTAPLRTPDDIEAAIRLMQDEDADSVVSITPAPTHPYVVYKLNGTALEPFLQSTPGMRRQDFPAAYTRNGAVYLVRVDVLRRKRSFFGDKLRALVMPPERSINIDEPIDWVVAEAVFARSNMEATR
jgi:CMP-N-acetylneuraminic acid synthetase